MGDYYFEVEMLPSQMPQPYVGVQSSLRVGFVDPSSDLSTEMPIGAFKKSYAFNQNGR
jgi:hypothetical protein